MNRKKLIENIKKNIAYCDNIYYLNSIEIYFYINKLDYRVRRMKINGTGDVMVYFENPDGSAATMRLDDLSTYDIQHIHDKIEAGE